ncbi:Cyclin-like F-box [Pleurostoma richardsiae]|uniref:Cyclin-like F-box n=1 Tax=Pleurostoma richardsiae TaxID=41990 RepID=A0AA38RR07_9PEZI|nr:Cyclin-like F-box [Pleurostoma richardsiae]
MSVPQLPSPNIVAADPARPPTPVPLIADLLRTGYCVPGSVFLVEGVDPVIPVSSHYRTVRLLLGDGELCIQALLRPELHGFADGGQVYVGCYVRLERFELRRVGVGGSDTTGDDGERRGPGDSQELQNRDQMVYLVIEDMVSVGWNERFMQLSRAEGEKFDADMEEPATENAAYQPKKAEALQMGPEEAHPSPPSRTALEGVKDEPDAEDTFESMEISEQKATQRRAETALVQQTSSRPGSSSANLPWAADADDLSRPLKLTPLRSIPNLPYKQNWTVNVLAVVASLSEVQPATLPPYSQRTARLADPSTAKQVLLTVFLDPDGFAPRVGSVVLLLGVKNHRFDGGSLKKYGNERPMGGRGWWLEDPTELEWCDVEGLRRWWHSETS